MNTDVTTQSIQEKLKLRVLPAVFVLAGVAFLAGAVYMVVTSSISQTTMSISLSDSLATIQPECDPLLDEVQVIPLEPENLQVPIRKTESLPICPYAAGELIVKFKQDGTINNLLSFTQKKSISLFGRLSDPVVVLSAENKLITLEKVFPSTLSVERLKQKFPQRAARASTSVTPPKLNTIYKLSFPADTNIVALAQQYGQLAEVEYAEPNYIVKIDAVPNDPLYSTTGSWQVYSAPNTGSQAPNTFPDMWGLKRINAAGAWDVSTGSSSVVVAISDTGIDYNHPDIQGQMWRNPGEIPGNNVDDDNNGFIDDLYGWDHAYGDNDPYDGDGHGTHVAGTVGAATNNNLGVAGINWNVKLMATKGLDDAGSGYTNDLMVGIQYAIDNGADVVNMSWGGGSFSQFALDSLENAYVNGVVVVASAGNGNTDTPQYPAAYPHVISVGAWCPDNVNIWRQNTNLTWSQRCVATPGGDRALFSNFGQGLDITAPGVDILSLRASAVPPSEGQTVSGNYWPLSGTSMAAPHVTGVAAMLLLVEPTSPPRIVELVMQGGAEDVGVPGKDVYSGYGLLNAAGAVAMMSNAPEQAELRVTDYSAQWLDAVNGEFVVTIENAGLMPADNVEYTFLDTFGTITPALLPGASTTLTLSFTSTSLPVDRRLTFAVDPDDVINEYIESDNTVGYLFTLLPGWPQIGTDDSSGVIDQQPVIADLDSTYPGLEVLIGYDDMAGRLSAWHADGTPVPGWPVDRVPDQAGTYVPSWFSPPVVIDLIASNPGLEVVVRTNQGVKAFSQNGVVVANLWSKSYDCPVREYGGLGKCNTPLAAGDLDGDGQPELVVHNYALRVDLGEFGYRGYLLSGWPVQTSPLSSADPYTAILANLDPTNPGNEVVIANYQRLNAFRADGTTMPNWPQLNENQNAEFTASPAVADLDHDGMLEVVAAARDYIWAWRANGFMVEGFPVRVSNLPTLSGLTSIIIQGSPIITDFEHDGQKEIIIRVNYRIPNDDRTQSYVFALHSDGTVVKGWPKQTNTGGFTSPAAGDLDGDGQPEVIVYGTIEPTFLNWRTSDGKIYAWHADGSLVDGFPIFITRASHHSSPSLADINGDGRLDIVVGAANQKVYAFTTPGVDNSGDGGGGCEDRNYDGRIGPTECQALETQ